MYSCSWLAPAATKGLQCGSYGNALHLSVHQTFSLRAYITVQQLRYESSYNDEIWYRDAGCVLRRVGKWVTLTYFQGPQQVGASRSLWCTCNDWLPKHKVPAFLEHLSKTIKNLFISSVLIETVCCMLSIFTIKTPGVFQTCYPWINC